MKDALELVTRTNIDLHFGRLTPLPPSPSETQEWGSAASALNWCISEHILNGADSDEVDISVQRHIFNKNNALPQWLVNKGLVACNNDRQRLESAVMTLLQNDFYQRRFLDYISEELLFHSWLWADDEDKRAWSMRRASELCENSYSIALNTQDFVVKIDKSVVVSSLRQDNSASRWYIKLLGTLNLIDFTTQPIYEYTAKLLEAKYKTSFILDVFKQLFKDTRRTQSLEHWGILVLGDIPKTFSLADYRTNLSDTGLWNPDKEVGVTDVFRQALARFDDPGARNCPEARFRLGSPPPQPLVEKVGAMFWLRRTLDAVKTIQQQQSVPQHGLRVEERSFLKMAMKQKCILYCNLFDDQLDPEINPCAIQAINDTAMVLQSPKGNKLNESLSGQEIHGYFSIVDGKQKSTYCDFRTQVRSIDPAGDNYCLVEIAFPAAFELTRRTHKRLHLNSSQLRAFTLIMPQPGIDWGTYDNLENWPQPLCRLPEEDALCQIKDLSAGGLMLEIHEDAPAFDYFVENNRDATLLAQLHLAGRQNLPDLLLPLCLKVKRIRHVAPLHKKYLGIQFVEAGEIKNQKYVRWHAVGKDGVYLIADWIFRDTISR